MVRRSTLAIALPAVTLAASIVALAAGQQTRTFKSGIEIVLIDVNVVDQTHVPVADLTADDFIVSVDSKPRTVASAQFVRYDVRTSTAREKTQAQAPAAPQQAVTPSAPPPARNVLLVVDVDSMEPGDGLLLQQEAAKFIDRLAPDDRVGVVAIPRIPATVELTKNRQQVRAALGRVITGYERARSQNYDIGTWEAFEAETDTAVLSRIIGRECHGSLSGACAEEVRGEVRWLRTQERLRGERSLEALRDLGLALQRIDGPKTMVLLSGGTPSPDRISRTWFALVAEALAAAQVSLYTLYLEQPDFQAKHRTSPTAGLDRLINRYGLEDATSGSGGTFMEAIGSWDAYFNRIVTEMSGAYLLGIEVGPADRDGRPHNVSVKVKRAGVSVRARTQYVIPADKKLP